MVQVHSNIDRLVVRVLLHLEWIDVISIKTKITENNTSALFISDFELLPYLLGLVLILQVC